MKGESKYRRCELSLAGYQSCRSSLRVRMHGECLSLAREAGGASLAKDVSCPIAEVAHLTLNRDGALRI